MGAASRWGSREGFASFKCARVLSFLEPRQFGFAHPNLSTPALRVDARQPYSDGLPGPELLSTCLSSTAYTPVWSPTDESSRSSMTLIIPSTQSTAIPAMFELITTKPSVCKLPYALASTSVVLTSSVVGYSLTTTQHRSGPLSLIRHPVGSSEKTERNVLRQRHARMRLPAAGRRCHLSLGVSQLVGHFRESARHGLICTKT